MAGKLSVYRSRRRFGETPEPEGARRSPRRTKGAGRAGANRSGARAAMRRRRAAASAPLAVAARSSRRRRARAAGPRFIT